MPAALLVTFVWTITAMPFVLGVATCPTASYLHAPCPGCGMTRALASLARGDLDASLAMHPLALPTALSQAAFACATIAAAFVWGAPWTLVRARWGRAAIAFASLVLVLDLLLWIARWFGAFGGPVPV